MIRKLLTVLALAALPLSALAQSDVASLLTSSGRLFTVESMHRDEFAELPGDATYVLVMTIHEGDTQAMSFIPASLEQGAHTSPALAYDSDTGSLFAFWEHGKNNRLRSDLVFSIYRDGAWSPAVTIDSGDLERSTGLRIGVTKKIEVVNEEGKNDSIPELNVHATWWNDSGRREVAKYAMLTVSDGRVSNIAVSELTDFITERPEPRSDAVPVALNPALMRQPVIVEVPGRATIDVIFGETGSDELHNVTIKPVMKITENGRLRVPVGVRNGGIGTPSFRAETNGRIGGIESGSNIGIYFKTKDALVYSTYENGTWSEVRSLPVGRKLTHDVAIDAVRRLLEE